MARDRKRFKKLIRTNGRLTANSFREHREPNRLVARSRHSMFGVARDRETVARFQVDDLFIFKFQRGTSAQNYKPLVFVLIVPEPWRAAVRMRDNSLNLDEGILE